MGVEPLQFDAGVGGRELPIGFGMMLISIGLPSGDLSFESWLVGNTTIQALVGQDGEFGFGQVEPASVFGRVMPLETLGEAASFLGREGRVERGRRMGAQVVLNQYSLFGVGKMRGFVAMRMKPLNTWSLMP